MKDNDAIEGLTARLRKFRDERGWNKFHTPKDLAISVSVEAAELLEIFQWEPADTVIDKKLKAKLSNEAADVLLYLLMLCDIAEIDIVSAAADKIDRNEVRFPVDRSYGVAKPPSAV